MDESTYKHITVAVVVLLTSMLYTKIRTDRISTDGHTFVLAAVVQTKIDGTNYCNLLYREVNQK